MGVSRSPMMQILTPPAGKTSTCQTLPSRARIWHDLYFHELDVEVMGQLLALWAASCLAGTDLVIVTLHSLSTRYLS